MKIGEKREIVKKRVYLWHIKNKGLPYNKFEGHISWIVGVSCVMLAVLLKQMISIFHTEKGKNILFFGGIFFGGALGNLVERIRKKYVTDFIYIKGKGLPIFNFADVFICIGGIIFFLSSIFKKEN